MKCSKCDCECVCSCGDSASVISCIFICRNEFALHSVSGNGIRFDIFSYFMRSLGGQRQDEERWSDIKLSSVDRTSSNQKAHSSTIEHNRRISSEAISSLLIK